VSVLSLTCWLERGDLVSIDREIAEIERRIAREEGSGHLRWYSPLYRGMRALLSGHLDLAERLILAAHQHGQKVTFYDAARALEAQLFQLRIDQGRVGELEPAIRSARARYPTDFTYPTVHAYALAETGRLDEAAQAFAEVMAGYDPEWDQNRPVTLTVLASVCAALRDAAAAERLYTLALPLADHVVANLSAWICQGSFHWPLGKLARAAGRPEDAARHLDLAIERNRELGARTYLARAELDRAELWLEQGERPAARTLLGGCFDAADEMGLVAVARRARELLHQTLPHAASDQETVRLR
jgi:tetratricopeptide (TPR) repeat protein